MIPRLTIATPCTRPGNLDRVADSLASAPEWFDFRWIVLYDLVHGLGAGALKFRPLWLEEREARVPQWAHSPYGERNLNRVLGEIAPEEWFLQVADDTVVLEGFLPRLRSAIDEHPRAGAIVFRQEVGDGHRPAGPDHVRPGGIDAGQCAVRGDLVAGERFRDEPSCDGAFIARLHEAHPGRFVFVDEPGLVVYNALRPGEGLGWVGGGR